MRKPKSPSAMPKLARRRRQRPWCSFLISSFFVLLVSFTNDVKLLQRCSISKRVNAFVPRDYSSHRKVGRARRLSETTKDNRKAATFIRMGFVEVCEPVVSVAKTVADGYGTSLVQNPLPTKSLTAGLLCGVGDVIAQKRANASDGNGKTSVDYDPKRTLRFASKGCFGGILWMYWYDWIDGFLTYASFADESEIVALDATRVSFYTLLGSFLAPDSQLLQICQAHSGAIKTGVSMVMEQLLWCPLVYGTFEIPLSTLLNGARPQTIPTEVRSKLNGLLVSNFQVWTPANLVIYNAPLEWRLFLGNIIDLFWQSIVSDVAADCGGEECELPPDESSGISGEDVERTMMATATQSLKEGTLRTSFLDVTVPTKQSSSAAKESRIR